MLQIITHQIDKNKPYGVQFKVDNLNEVIHMWYITACLMKHVFHYQISPDQLQNLISNHIQISEEVRIKDLRITLKDQVFLTQFDIQNQEFNLRVQDK